MKKIVLYLLVCLLFLILLLILQYIVKLPQWYLDNILFAKCAFIGGIGGVLYCLRGVYLNKCVLKNWDDEWRIWYYLRPITSTISGFISCIFLKAGLLMLDASAGSTSIPYGYFAIAFIAGYNVDNFMKKIESIAYSVWGISKTKIAESESLPKEKDNG